jgi:DNA invertase Pin-like site-specific DNA recombinase
MSTTKRPTPAAPKPIAISYLRFSTPDQKRGDSTRRQTEATEAWCERNGIPLDRSLSMKDEGRSAYKGDNRSYKAALGRFLELVHEAKVPYGSYLIIENLDRLSRQDERTALRLWLDILDAGINIVQLHPETIFRHERSEMVDIIRAIIELSRGHSESRMKSVRSLANWDKARRLAREGKAQTPRRKDGRITTAITGRLPAWVEEAGGRLRLVPERATVVRHIFDLAAAGYGMTSIVKKLTAAKVPAFGSRVKQEDGTTRKVAGDNYGCGEWRRAYVQFILTDRRAIGEYQPRDAKRRAKGDPIPNYYPPAVTPEQFYAARAAMTGRKNKQGRFGNGMANLFGGLLKNARDGQSYYAATRSDNGAVSRVLLNKTYRDGLSRCYTFPYATFERGILSLLREVDPAQVVAPVPVTEVSVLQGELNWVRERKASLALELLKGDVAEIGDALRQLKDREAALVAKMEKNAETTAKPYADTWKDAHALTDLLDDADNGEREDVRLRLRAALRRVVKEMWLLVVPRGRDRLCACQVWFAGGTKCRDYLILHQSAGFRRPGGWHARSMAGVPGAGDLDLRQRADAQLLEEALMAVELAAEHLPDRAVK